MKKKIPKEKKIIQEIIDIAFKKARKKAKTIKGITKKETKRIKVAGKEIQKRLEIISKGLPIFSELSDFNLSMIKTEHNLIEVKKALAHLNKSISIIKRISKETLKKLNKNKRNELIVRKEFYGRVNSVVKRLDKSIKIINEVKKTIKSLPLLKEVEKIILIGLPNAGKTTILNKLSGSKAKVNVYPFTTKKINLGNLKIDKKEFQLIDCPGVLDRPISKMNKIELKAFNTLKNVKAIIFFIFDAKQEKEKQFNLMDLFWKEFKIRPIIIISKEDLLNEKEKRELIESIGKKVIFSSINKSKEGLIKEIKKQIK